MSTDVLKYCRKCQTKKELKDFGIARNRSDGLQSVCRECRKNYSAAIGIDGLTNRQRGAQKIGDDGLTHPERSNKKIGEDGKTASQRYVAKHPERLKASNLMSKYGITPEDFDARLARQNGQCAICKEPGKKLCLDHDHTTGKVRAFLCVRCNMLLGFLRDSASLATSAAEYLAFYARL